MLVVLCCDFVWISTRETLRIKVLLDAWRVRWGKMSGMTGASMLRTRRKDVNLKPNRKLDRKSSRGMLFENEELRLRTININAEVERGQSDIKKLKRENDQLKREISALRYEYDRLDRLLRDRKSSPDNSDDSASVCSACPECASVGSGRVFHDLEAVPEEGEEGNKSGVESPCTCDDCQQPEDIPITKQPTSTQMTPMMPNAAPNSQPQPGRPVDVLIHDNQEPQYFQSVTSPPYHVTTPPPPGFVLAPYQPPRFHTGGNVEDLLGDVQNTPTIQTTFIQQNSVFMCERKVLQKCCCQKREPVPTTSQDEKQQSYVTEKNIELTYDYPRNTPITAASSPKSGDEHTTTTTEVASTVVFVERRIPVKPKKFDFFFRSRSAPVGDHEEPIYATVNKLPKRLRRMELANLEKEVAYKSGEPDSSTRTELTLKTDSESQVPHPDDDTSRSEREKSIVPQRPDSPKAKKRKRFSLTFKKRERKRKEKKDKKKEMKNGVAKVPVTESDNERLIDKEQEKPKLCTRHRPRNTLSSSSSGPRYKRDSYQEMTTSHSEHERTNSVCSSVNSLASACTHKSRKLSAPPIADGSIPWCGCWGAGCV
ncbi:uncharacterized protein LOC133530765 isoform X2 [Cydia pomonella]|uniref:uncharacterized protein LOC133530765 isoform X2 n=1 Tax=Cydia pomonella TaxID=82600 RepID=UPI002ADE5F1D|nr:uncharacterized protein LOC133530765 isoform X2 [Cydia pomonella]